MLDSEVTVFGCFSPSEFGRISCAFVCPFKRVVVAPMLFAEVAVFVLHHDHHSAGSTDREGVGSLSHGIRDRAFSALTARGRSK
jgi:hypothetical protein